jgi:hypothetical protein
VTIFEKQLSHWSGREDSNLRPLPPEDLARRRVSQKSAVFRQSPHPVFTVRPPRSGTVAERGLLRRGMNRAVPKTHPEDIEIPAFDGQGRIDGGQMMDKEGGT